MINPNSEIQIGKRTIKNRITMAPTVKFAARDDGLVTDEFVEHYELRAKSGVGLIVLEATCVAKEARLHPKQLGLWCDEQIDGHRRIVEAVHKYGTLIIPQIHYGGLGTHPECGPLTSPTKVEWNDGYHNSVAVELTTDDIKRIETEFINAAIRAKKAGYDGVQLHACHSYLIDDFTSSVNKRVDEYGGSNINRARFGCEIIEGIRRECGEDFIISARVTGCDPTIEDSIEINRYYVEAGCDYLQVSTGIDSFDDLEHNDNLPYNKIVELGVNMKRRMQGLVPVSVVNGLRTVEAVKYIFENELADTVDLACGLLADPRFTEAILSEKEFIPCFNCPNCAYGPDHKHKCPAAIKRGITEFSSVF